MPLGDLKRVDFYRRVPKDLTEATTPGAILSICAIVIMTLLFLGEVVSYVSPGVRAQMFVAPDEGQGARIKVNFNMTFHKLPCFLFALDTLDVLGRHEVGVSVTAKKYRVSESGENLGEFHSDESAYGGQVREGCMTVGYVNVAKVPGNFHVSAHPTAHLAQRYTGGVVNVEHTIHYMWFGDLELNVGHGFEGEVHPLNGLVQRDNGVETYEYFLDIVPTVYGHKNTQRGYQFTANVHKQPIPNGHMAAAWFRYQMSPITVKYETDRVPFFHFLTYVCAIVGGVFTVAGMLSKTVHESAVQFQRRVLGKDI